MKRDIHIVTLLRKMKQKRLLRRVIAFLSVIVLLVTVNTLKFEADTLEHVATCGFEEHSHEEACFDENGALSCALTEHVHTDACFQNRPVKAAETDIEQPVEEMQTFELDDDADDELNARAFSAEAVMLDDGIEASADELDTFELSESEAIAPDFAAKREGYTVGSQYPFLLSDVIAEQGLNISIDDVTRIEQLFENDEPDLFRYELMDGDIALYPTADFELARLLIYTDNDVELVELLFGIAPTVEPVPDDEIEQSIYVEIEEKAMPIEPDEESEPLEESETVEKTETIEETETVKEIEEEAEEITEEETETEEVTETVEETEEENDAEQPEENDGEAMDEPLSEEIAADVAPAMHQAEATVSHYVATIDLSDIDAFPVALDALMAQAERVMIAEAAQSVDATIEPVDVNMESIGETIEPAVDEIEASIEETTVTLEDVVETQADGEVSETLEPLESEAIEPMLGEITIELGSDEAPGIPSDNAATTDDWALDYDAALLSIERTDEGYMLSVTGSFEQTVVIVNNGELYVLTLLNGAVRSEYPAATFSAATEHVVVNVEAPEGAFPAGTTMVVTDVEDEDTISSIAGKVEEGFVRVERVHAVDITFLNAEGVEIEPLIPISVTMSVREIEAEKETVVVHVDHDGEAQIVAETTQVVSEAVGEELTAEADTALAFVADAFSVYAVVVGEKLETMAIAADGNTYRIEVTFAENASLPAGAALAVSEVTDDNYLAQVQQSMAGEKRITMARFFDIKIMNGDEEIQPDAPVMVKVALDSDAEKEADAVPCAVHFTGDEISVIKATEADEAVSFRAESFSVWGVVYTVDFHWEVNGKAYSFSIPGGGFIRLSDIVEALGLAGGEAAEAETDMDESQPAGNAELDRFMESVTNVTFSDPALIWAGQTEADCTLGELKDAHGLDAQYSDEWTEEQIEALNRTALQAGEWLLVSLKPFITEEELTVELSDGESFVIRVTDAQISKTVISATGDTYEVIATYGEDAEIPDGAELSVTEITETDDAYRALYVRADGVSESLLPAHPAMFDISIVYNDQEVEPAPGSQVFVEVRLVKDKASGFFSASDAFLQINDQPVNMDEQTSTQTLRVIHAAENGELEKVDVESRVEADYVTGQFTTDSFSNWLLYLDEDLDVININKGDSITLRGRSEWIWHYEYETTYKDWHWNLPAKTVTSIVDGVETGNIDFYAGYTYQSKTDGQNNDTYDMYVIETKEEGRFYIELRDANNQLVKRIQVNIYPSNALPDKPPFDTVADDEDRKKIKINLFNYDNTGSPNTPEYWHVLDEAPNKAEYWSAINSNYVPYNDDYWNSVSEYNRRHDYNLNINYGHTLKFVGWGYSGTYQKDNQGQPTDWANGANWYTQQYAHQGIVKARAGSDHFPVLNQNNNQNNNESLSYLFDKGSQSDEAILQYSDVDGLLQRDDHDYFYFNSNSNYAEFDEAANKINLYTHTYSQRTDGSGGDNAKPIGFYPFHEYDSTKDLYMNHDKALDHHLGMSMEFQFVIPEDGLDRFGDPIEFEFSGDDDLWVFIDDALVMDVGGLHQPITSIINFADDQVVVNGVYPNIEKATKSLQQCYTDADIEGGWQKGPEHVHTLRMFYMERGGCDSNLSIRFNMPVLKGTGEVEVTKINKDSVPLEGAEFTIYSDAACTKPVMTQSTHGNGKAVFNNLNITGVQTEYYMRETKAPTGYLENYKTYIIKPEGKPDGNGIYQFHIYDSVTKDDVLTPLGQIPADSVVNVPEVPISLSIEKEWQNADGTPGEPPEGAQAAFRLRRYRLSAEALSAVSDEVTLEIYWSAREWKSNTGWTNINSLLDSFRIKRGENANITYAYTDFYVYQNRAMWYSEDTPIYESGNGEVTLNNQAGSFTVQIPSTGVKRVYFNDTYAGYQVLNDRDGGEVSVNATAPESGFIVQKELDPNFVPPDFVLDGKTDDYETTAWRRQFDNLPLTGTDADGSWQYTYFFEEVRPGTNMTGYTVVYYDADGRVMPYAGAAATNVGGNTLKVANRAPRFIDISAVKIWKNASGQRRTWPKDPENDEQYMPSEIEVKLQSRVDEGEWADVDLPHQILTPTSPTATYSHLRHLNDDEKVIQYQIVEVNVPAGYEQLIEQTTDSEGNITELLINKEESDGKLRIKKLWRGIVDPSSFQEIRVNLYRGWAAENGSVEPGFKQTVQSDIVLNNGNNWTWVSPNILPSDDGNGHTYGYWIEETTDSGGDWKFYSYGNSENDHVTNSQGQGYFAGFSGGEGTLFVTNAVMRYRQMDIKKKFVTLEEDGSWNTITQDSSIKNGVTMGFKVIRQTRSAADNSIVQTWTDYGEEMLVGYNSAGEWITWNGNNPFHLQKGEESGGDWHFRIIDQQDPNNPESDFVGLPEEGYYNGQKVKYEYSFRETGVYRSPQNFDNFDHSLLQPYEDWEWYSTITPPTYTDVNGQTQEFYQTPLNGDTDRVFNFQASNILIDKDWAEGTDLTGIEEVYVKLYRYTGDDPTQNREDFTEIIAADMAGSTAAQTDSFADRWKGYNWQGYVDPSRIDTTNKWLILKPDNEGNWETPIRISSAVLRPISGNAQRYHYYIEEVGYRKNDEVHDSVAPYAQRYWRVVNGTKTETLSAQGNAIELGMRNTNALGITNAISQIDIVIYKVDKGNLGLTTSTDIEAVLLSGAEFEIHRYTDENYTSLDTGFGTDGKMSMTEDTETSGKFTATGLEDGYYKICETKYPDGYVKTTDDPKFRVQNGQLELIGENAMVQAWQDEAHTIVIGNEPGVALPATGGPGTTLFYVLGSVLTLLAALLLISKWRADQL